MLGILLWTKWTKSNFIWKRFWKFLFIIFDVKDVYMSASFVFLLVNLKRKIDVITYFVHLWKTLKSFLRWELSQNDAFFFSNEYLIYLALTTHSSSKWSELMSRTKTCPPTKYKSVHLEIKTAYFWKVPENPSNNLCSCT